MIAQLILDDLQNRGGEPGIRFWVFHTAFASLQGPKWSYDYQFAGGNHAVLGRPPSARNILGFPSTPQAPNARFHLLPEAGAQRTLEAVGCRPMVGLDVLHLYPAECLKHGLMVGLGLVYSHGKVGT
jgi:hypothetical protein